MRKRMIDPEFFLDEELAKLSPHARLLYIGSWMLADDNVFTFPYKPGWIKVQLFPYEKVKIDKLNNELIGIKKFLPFEYEGKPYIYVPNIAKHQKIEKPSKQKYPAYSGSSRGAVGEQSGSTLAEVKLSKEKLSKVNIREEKEKHLDFVALTPEEYRKLQERMGKVITDKYILQLNNYIGSKGKKYKSHYFTILSWANRDGVAQAKPQKVYRADEDPIFKEKN